MKAMGIVLTMGLALMLVPRAWAQRDDGPADANSAEATGEGRTVLGVMIAAAEGEKGAKVVGVAPESPAAKAGLREGDEIASVDKQKITSPEQLAQLVHKKRPGDKLEIVYRRDNHEKTATAILADRAGRRREVRGEREGEERRERRADRSHLGVFLGPSEGKGVRVLGIEPGSPAERAGVREGDVVLRIGGQQVSSPEEARKAVDAQKPREKFDVVVLRDGKETTLQATLAARSQERRESGAKPMPGPGIKPMPGMPGMPIPGMPMREMIERHREMMEQLNRLEKVSQELVNEVRGLRKDLQEMRAERSKGSSGQGKPKEGAKK